MLVHGAACRHDEIKALGYGVGNLGKFIGPAGLAVIAGSSNFISPRRRSMRSSRR